MNSNRIPWFDNVKGIMIFLVVFGHLISTFKKIPGNEPVLYIYNVIYVFHMPLFVMISGYFYRDGKYKKVIQFLFLFFLWHLINGMFVNFIEERKPVVIDPGHRLFEVFDPYWTMWYLLGMIFWYMITPYITRLRYPLVYAIIFAFLLSYSADVTGWFALRKLANFYPYFLIGYYLAQKNLLNRLKENLRKRQKGVLSLPLLVLLSFLAGMVYLTAEYPKITDLLLLDQSYRHFSWPFYKGAFYQLLFYGLSGAVSLTILLLTPEKKKLFLFHTFGLFSLNIYLLHTFFVRVFRLTVPETVYANAWLLILVSCILSFLICGFSSHRLVRKLTGPFIKPDLQFLFKTK